MKQKIKWIAATALIGLLISPASGQFSAGYNFIKAVRDRDGAKVTEIVEKPGSVIIDTRDDKNGETGLHIVTRARDLIWMNFLLARGARPDLRDKVGNTPLMIAAQLGYVEGTQLLLSRRALVDFPNSAGETPLIRAVQNRNSAVVQLLMNAGANPAKTDTLAGLSARDYAKRDVRAAAILKILDAAKPLKSGAISGPK